MQKDLLFWIWLAEALGSASKDFRRLISLYESPYELFHAEEAEIERIENLPQRTVRALTDKGLVRATEIFDRCEQLGINVLPYGAPDYPEAFYDLMDPPVLLYYKGRLPDFTRRLSIAMVGTRKMSEYGLRAAYKISYELATAGAIVVSGMAAGIDGVCAAGALAANGTTVAILGCGIDVVYPRHHKGLRDEILNNGVLISEYAPGTRPNSYHFPLRNRLIAGLSQGVMVVEAGIGSGSLITAKDAVVMGKDVFALPANVGSVGAEGTNGLLRDGARPVMATEDLLKPYLYLYSEKLSLEALQKVGTRSRVDLQYLDRMGVIELTAKGKDAPMKKERAEVASPKTKTEKKHSRKNVAEPTKAPKASDEGTAVGSADAPSANRQKTPDEVLSTLSPVQLAIMNAIPDDHGVTADSLSNLGYPYGEISSALTMLEILGLVQKLPGALYVKI